MRQVYHHLNNVDCLVRFGMNPSFLWLFLSQNVSSAYVNFTKWFVDASQAIELQLNWGMFPAWGERLMRALGGRSKSGTSGGTSWEGWWRQWCTSGCLPWHTDLALHIHFFSVFKDLHYISPPALSHLFSLVYTLGFDWVPRGSTKSEMPDQHRAPLTSGFRRRQSWVRNSFLPGISCLGAGKVVRDSKLNYEFSVQLRSLPDKFEPNTRCITNILLLWSSLQ